MFKEIFEANKPWIKKYFFKKSPTSLFQLSDRDIDTLHQYPNMQVGALVFGSNPFKFSNADGFLHSYQEIFLDNIYRFESKNERPYILDCGANIGLSVLYFKNLFPNAEIEAFEPDKAIFDILEENITKSRNLTGITLHNKAVWIEDTTLFFFEEGSLAGSLVGDFANTKKKVSVEAIDLKKVLKSRSSIQFLKIDIEGAENDLIFDIIPFINNVENLFLEYHSITKEDQKLGNILSELSKAGFRYYIKEAVNSNSAPFINKNLYNNLFDLQLNIFCYR